MIEHFYRFRRMNYVLEELAGQEIYFTPPEELDDPMEGYKDVFWLGDRIVWRNLLRHYLLCLLHMACRTLLIPTGLEPLDLKTIVLSAPEELPQAPIREIYRRMCEAFLADASVATFIEAMAARSTPLRRDELTHRLRVFHPFALSLMAAELKKEGADQIFRDLNVLDELAAKDKELAARTTAFEPPNADIADELYAAFELKIAQMELIHDYNNAIPPEAKALNAFTRDFPASYVRALDELIHPPCFVACFVENPSNASLWATYGDKHRGICLKFKTVADSAGRPALNLNAIRGLRGGPGPAMEPVYSFAPHAFHKVNYTDSYPKIDFFNSIGRPPIPKLNGVWYNGDNHERSSCRMARYYDTDAWRQKYWDAFLSGACCKTSEWEHQQEHRLLLSAEFRDLREKSSRKLRYKFSDLSGIIFGAKTAFEDKIKIMRIIEEKCRSEKRDDFEFYQAQYSRTSRSFRIVPLSLIRLRQNNCEQQVQAAE